MAHTNLPKNTFEISSLENKIFLEAFPKAFQIHFIFQLFLNVYVIMQRFQTHFDWNMVLYESPMYHRI